MQAFDDLAHSSTRVRMINEVYQQQAGATSFFFSEIEIALIYRLPHQQLVNV